MLDRLTANPRTAHGQGVVRTIERRSGLPCRAPDLGIAPQCRAIFGGATATVRELLAAAAERDRHELDAHALVYAARPLDALRRRPRLRGRR